MAIDLTAPATKPEEDDTSIVPIPNEVWIFRATDDDGLSDHLQVRCQPGVARFFANVLHSNRFPYATESDIMRHAIHRHVEWLKEQSGCPNAPPTLLAKLNRMWEEEQVYVDFEETVSRAGELIRHALSHNMHRRAKRIVHDLLAEVIKMQDSECKSYFEFEIHERFKNLL